jgi:hypothetical protein
MEQESLICRSLVKAAVMVEIGWHFRDNNSRAFISLA